MKKMNQIFAALLLSLSVVSCGTNDPLEIFDNAMPELNTIAIGSYALSPGGEFTVTTPYWRFLSFGGNLIAPARGVITEIAPDTQFGTGSYSIKIAHNGRLATRVVGIQLPTSRVGDYVVAGQAIGGFFGGNVIFQVIFDNRNICPLSFMSDSFRSTFYAGVTGNPCR